MSAEENTVRARMAKNFNIAEGVPFSDLLNVHYYDEQNRFFHTADGRFARVWHLATAPADVLPPGERLVITNELGRVFNQFPEGSSGQYIRYTHKDIYPLLDQYMSDSEASTFGADLVRSVVKRQLQGAESGFFGGVSRGAINSAKEAILGEGELDTEKREALVENIERSMTTGRFAFMTDSYLVFLYTPYWTKSGYMITSWVKKTVAAIGLGDVKDDFRAAYEKERDTFLEHCARIEAVAANAGFDPGRLGAQALINVMYRELNPKRALSTAPPEFRQDYTIRELLSLTRREPGLPNVADHALFSDLETKPDGWVIDGVHYKVASAKVLPKNITPGRIYDALAKIESENWAVLNFVTPPQGGVRNMLRIRRTTLNSNPLASHPFFAGDPILKQQKAEDIELAVNATNIENIDRVNVVDVNIHIVVKNADESVATESVKSLTGLLWAGGLQETNRADAIIHQCLPLNYRTSTHQFIARQLRLLTPNLGDIAPHFTAFNGVSSPGMLVNNQQGMPIFIDIFSTRAGHSLIQGGTGSGKSFLANNIFMQLQKYDPKIFIVDKGGSYRSLCVGQGGSYVDLVLDDEDGVEPVNINPFYTKPGQPLGNIEKEFMRDILVAMIKCGTDENVMKEEQNLLLTAVETAFERKGGEELVLSDIHRYLDTECGEKGKSLARRFVEFTAGNIYGKMFDGRLTANWDANIIVFETQRVAASKALSVIMMALFYQVNNYCKFELPRQKRKIFAVDEAWAALADPTAATAIAGMYREMRKYRTAVFLISQTIKDFSRLISSDGSGNDGIIANTRHFFLLASTAADHAEAKTLLNMTDAEISSWASVASLPPYFSECFYRMLTDKDTPHSGKFRLYSTPLALWTATTTPEDIALRDALAKKYRANKTEAEARREALLELADRFPLGYRHHIQQGGEPWRVES